MDFKIKPENALHLWMGEGVVGEVKKNISEKKVAYS
ncbi:uncharacterized protein METZ01_LOCUS365449 [marine metagenome]|uniref:Uncharacterized protein n=1 Tax=marine metagenome TaxID=408172 RepID=A0A382SSY2_9ZZZZ